MFVLKNKEIGGYTYGEWTFYKTNHKGTDYRANYVNLYAPFDCYVDTFQDVGGGNWLQFHFRQNGNEVIVQCAHLSKYLKTGDVTEGTVVAVTGNSGQYTSGPHLHLQIKINGNLIDPETFNWEGDEMTPELRAELDDHNKRLIAIDQKVIARGTAIKNVDAKVEALTKTVNEIASKLNVAPTAPVLSTDDQEAISAVKGLLAWFKSLFK